MTSEIEDSGGDDGGTTDGSTGDDTTTSGSDDDGLLPNVVTGWDDLSIPSTLQAFLSDPQRFIFGAIAVGILEVVFGIVAQLLDLVLLVLGGTKPYRFAAPGESYGLADIPVALAESLASAIRPTGGMSGVIGGIESFNEPLFQAASSLGPLSPVIITAVVIGETIVVLLVLRRILLILLDVIPGGGGLT